MIFISQKRMGYIKFCSFPYMGKHLPIEKEALLIIVIAKRDAHFFDGMWRVSLRLKGQQNRRKVAEKKKQKGEHRDKLL